MKAGVGIGYEFEEGDAIPFVFYGYLDFVLDPSSQPRRFDLICEGHGRFRGSYDLKDDRMTIGWKFDSNAKARKRNSARPPETLTAGPNVLLVVLKRVTEPAATTGGATPKSAANRAAETSLQFGPVIERLVYDAHEEQKNNAINLASGKLVL